MASLEKKVARLEAIEAIKQPKFRYLFNCDRKDPKGVRACFVDGPCPIDFGRIGRFDSADALVEVYSRLACQDHIVEIHHGQNPQIELIGDDLARGIWGLFYFLIDTSLKTITQHGGHYEDEYRVENSAWKIIACRNEIISTTILDWSSGLERVIFAGRQAPIHIDNPVNQAG